MSRHRVTGVTAGDTLTVLDAKRITRKVRVSGIDAPESTQPFRQRSKQSLSGLAYGKDTREDCPKHDRYKRLVCTVYVDGIDVGLAQVAAGMAWWYRKYAHEQTPEQRPAYSNAELKASQQRIGLWADEAPTPPWEYRYR